MEKLIIPFRVVLRAILFLFIVLNYLAVAFYIHFTVKENWQRRRQFSRNVHKHCIWICRFFNIIPAFENRPEPDASFLYVGNHLGFIDILALAAERPYLFVTSQEMRETPVLGLLCEMGGCIFVERRSRKGIKDELGELTQALENGLCVALYPEATSTNGEAVLPFKRTLMMSAPQAGKPIVPGAFNFRKINNDPFIMKWRDHVCWYGDIPFHESIIKAWMLKEVHVSIDFLDEIHATPDHDRAQVAEAAHAKVRERFEPVRV